MSCLKNIRLFIGGFENPKFCFRALVMGVFIFGCLSRSLAQDASVNARLDSRQITVGDQARLFIEVKNNPSTAKIQWPAIPDTVNNLEIVEKGKIDTIKDGGMVSYRQRLLITGFDSGLFTVPSFTFSVIPDNGEPRVIQTDSFNLLVQTVAVDTTKGFKGIKNIIYVRSSWLDYIWYICGGIILVLITIVVVLYIIRKRKITPPKPQGPAESLTDKTLRLLSELDARQLWQKNKVKEYYVELTDIVRNYIEERFHTPAMELTTDELLYKVQLHRELQPYQATLSVILHTADLAKFAKAQPLPQEHTDAMEKAREFVQSSRPIIIETPTEKNI